MKFLPLIITSLIASIGVAHANNKPVLGLEVKERKAYEEGQREILIQNKATSKYSEAPLKTQDAGFFNSFDRNNQKFYITFAFSSQLNTKISDDSFGKVEKMNVAIPIADRRFGGELFFGKFIDKGASLSAEIGVDYNFAYFDNDKNQKFGLHAISPSIRLLYHIFPTQPFSIYIGGLAGIAILDLVKGGDYNVQYAPQFGGLAGVTYRFGEKNPIEVFAGYKNFFISQKTFTVENKEYKTGFSGHALHIGFRIKY